MGFLDKLKADIAKAIQDIKDGTAPADTGIGKMFKSLQKASPEAYADLLSEYKPVAAEYFKANPPSTVSREYLVQKEMRAIEASLDTGDEDQKEREPRQREPRQHRPRVPQRSKGERDRSVYEFAGSTYGKGQLALRIVAKFVEDNDSCDINVLKAAFPDTLLRSYGIVQEIEEARRRSGSKPRYFMGENKTIKLSDGTVVVVSNQYTTENFQPFLKRAKELGYAIMEPERQEDYLT